MFDLVVFNLDGNLATQLKEVYGKDENCLEAIKDMQLGIESDFSLSKKGVLLRLLTGSSGTRTRPELTCLWVQVGF